MIARADRAASNVLRSTHFLINNKQYKFIRAVIAWRETATRVGSRQNKRRKYRIISLVSTTLMWVIKKNEYANAAGLVSNPFNASLKSIQRQLALSLLSKAHSDRQCRRKHDEGAL
jgi:hypothetical protein